MQFSTKLVAVGLGVAMGRSVTEATKTGLNRGPVGKVVSMLEDMLETSKKEGEEERVVYAKFKCYCDTNEREKMESIDKNTEEIAMLEANIKELQGSNAKLSYECAQLQADITANKAETKARENLRKAAEDNWKKEENDFKAAQKSLKEAVDVLKSIGNGASFMASKEKLAKLQSTLRQALVASNSVVTEADNAKLQSFLQNVHVSVSNSGEEKITIIKILEKMLETFKENLHEARKAEKEAVKYHENYMKTSTADLETMEKQKKKKEETVGSNEELLGEKKDQRVQAKDEVAAAEDFLDELRKTCEEKAKSYDERNVLRLEENAALAQAIAILNSDAAFSAFGKTDATGFLQLRTVHRHLLAPRASAESALAKVAQHSDRVRRVAALLEGGNPFDKVLGEIKKMIKVIQEEGKLDQEKLDWCNEEREANDANLDKKVSLIDSLNTDITDLDNSINNPDDGFKAQIKSTESDLEENADTQKTQTDQRKVENEEYQKNIVELDDAHRLLKEAKHVLSKYYDTITFAQKKTSKESPEPPETWEGDYKGQSGAGGKVITILEEIIADTEKEKEATESAEKESQTDFDDSMSALKAEEEELESSLTQLKKDLADATLSHQQKSGELKVTKHEKGAIEKYLVEIKPGCDFITENFDTREANRADEKAALEEADKLIKGTPAYKKAAK